MSEQNLDITIVVVLKVFVCSERVKMTLQELGNINVYHLGLIRTDLEGDPAILKIDSTGTISADVSIRLLCNNIRIQPRAESNDVIDINSSRCQSYSCTDEPRN